ncbi:CAMK protein kinase [Phytophthora cinnamomi]|uniref:CAMK protein kinase n=1 Tax=Phytophthora cinnamomi TaxID=4785 RepID=UPI003559A849|nr:CAMK protein kinase [Phytophthora cinnamomi]
MTTSQLRFQRKLADALYGEVTECELRPTARQRQRSPSIPLDEQLVVAVKCISLPYAVDMRARHGAGRNLDDPLQECRVASLLATSGGGHPNVVRSYFHFLQHDCLYLVSEYCADGDLYTHLTTATRNGSMDECTSVHFMKEVLSGVAFLHRQLGIAHRDLSLENVLMHNGVCKISDFGLSVGVGTRCVGPVGKQYYMAPEVVASDEYDPVKADIWSLGVMWFILLTGSPFVSVASGQSKAFVALEECGVAAVFESWKLTDRLSASIVGLVSKMLIIDPVRRISLDEILEHELLHPGESC